MNEDRDIYRKWVSCGELISFSVAVAETDLLIQARSNLSARAVEAVRVCRKQIEEYIARHPEFKTSLEPCDVENALPVVEEMAEAARLAGVGPMAAVAGAVAGFVGRKLKESSEEVIVENGGDIYVETRRDITVGLFAGNSSFTGKLSLAVRGEDTPLGICTSSGTVGHSLSFGRADAVTVICRSAAVADAYATAFANKIKEPGDVEAVVQSASSAPKVLGFLAVLGDKLGTWGNIQFTR